MTEDKPDYHPDRGFVPAGEDPVEQLQRHAAEHPFVADLGMAVDAYEDGVLRMSVPHKDKFANPGMEGTLHGGIVMSILDTAMGFTMMATVADDPTVESGPTINLNVNFLKAATSDMVATGEIVRMGSSTGVVDGTLREADSGETIATAQGVWRVYQNRDQQ